MQTKTLLITFLPSLEQSRTAHILRAFRERAEGKTVIREIDLIKQRPSIFLPATLAAYKKRNYMNQTLDPQETSAIAGMDAMTDAVTDADHIVLAYPMHNFGLPAPVKAFFDSILLKGRTWNIGASGYVGLLKGKTALILTSCGGSYEGAGAAMDHSVPYAKQLLGFTGITDIEVVAAQKMNMSTPAEADAIIKAACARAAEIADKRYS